MTPLEKQVIEQLLSLDSTLRESYRKQRDYCVAKLNDCITDSIDRKDVLSIVSSLDDESYQIHFKIRRWLESLQSDEK